ncbi:MAG: hypothetical protein JRM99_05445 [Nitrososphaerota archaeon]|nr:hypothetical protein [Nitrososphaerota archaeon]MDG6990850.1 hypothetical protein [Nitrososphaerota archaeon]
MLIIIQAPGWLAAKLETAIAKSYPTKTEHVDGGECAILALEGGKSFRVCSFEAGTGQTPEGLEDILTLFWYKLELMGLKKRSRGRRGAD